MSVLGHGYPKTFIWDMVRNCLANSIYLCHRVCTFIVETKSSKSPHLGLSQTNN